VIRRLEECAKEIFVAAVERAVLCLGVLLTALGRETDVLQVNQGGDPHDVKDLLAGLRSATDSRSQTENA
jgi:hypothetical protein